MGKSPTLKEILKGFSENKVGKNPFITLSFVQQLLPVI